MLARLAAKLRWGWSLATVALCPLAQTEASPTCEIGYLYESRPLKAFNIVGTSRSYLKTLGNCLPRNNILTLASCQGSDNWDFSASDIMIASDLWLVTSHQCCPMIGWHPPQVSSGHNNHRLDCGRRVNIYIQTSKYWDTDTWLQ